MNAHGTRQEQRAPSAVGRTASADGGRAARQLGVDDLRHRAVEVGRSRLLLVGAVLLLGFGVVGGRLVQVTSMTEGQEPSLARVAIAEAPRPERADIVDRNGVLLATNLPTASLYADPARVIDPADAARRLRTVLPRLDEQRLIRLMTGDRRFVYLKRHLTPAQQVAINRLGIPGLHFQREERRIYPQGASVAHVVGYTDVDLHGLSGVERFFDNELSDRSAPLRLSLDIRVQHLLRGKLLEAIAKHSALGGAGIVYDVERAEVVAMVSLPDFDPHRAGAMTEEQRFNRATLGVFELGSTFKILNTAMALESGAIKITDQFDARYPIRIGRYRISDYHAKARWLTVPEIFRYSSNIGSAKMALAAGTDAQRAFMKRLGMLRETAIELPERGAPLSPDPWREINTMTIAFGHGIAVSPLHLVNAVASLVNGGTMRPASLLLHANDDDPARNGERVVSPRTSDAIRRLLRAVVESGTGRKAAVPGYLVGGKTGTAEKSSKRGYRRKALISSFIAVYPMNRPRYVVFAMLDEPKGTKDTHGYATGGWVAAPVVGAVIAGMAPIVGLPPQDPENPNVRAALDLDRLPGGPTLASY